MSKGSFGLAAMRKTVSCTNEECPEVASKGRPWKGQVKAGKVETTVCPRCSSAVVMVAPDEDPEPEPVVAFVPLADLPPKPRLLHPFMGIPRHELGSVRVGMAARQYLLGRAKRGESLEQVAARTLDELAAGTLDTGAA